MSPKISSWKVVEPSSGMRWAYYERLARRGARVGLLLREAAAGVDGLLEPAGLLLGLLLVVVGVLAEAAVGVAALHEELGVVHIEPAALGLHIGADGAADVRALVVLEAAFGERAVDDVHRALDEPALVGVLDAEDELAAVRAGDKVGVERGAQVADVHIARGAGREARAHLAARDARFHILKPLFIFHVNPSLK